MNACEGSAEDDDGSGGAERFGSLSPQLRRMRSAADSDIGGARDGCSADRARQADRSVLLHGLCAATIALATARIVLATALNAFAAYMVSVCVLSPVLRALSWSLFRLGRPRGRRTAKANAIDNETGCPIRDDGDRSVPQRRPLALSFVRRGLRLLMRAMRNVQRSIVICPKRFQRLTRRTGSRRTDTACSDGTTTAETVTSSRAGND